VNEKKEPKDEKNKTWTSCDGESLFQVNNHRIGKQSKRVYIYNKVRRANSCSARPGQQRRSKTFRRPLQCFALNAGAAFSDNILLPPCLFNPVISFQRRSSSSNLTFLLHHRIPAKIKKDRERPIVIRHSLSDLCKQLGLGCKSITHMMETAAGVFVVAAITTSGHDNFAAEDEIPVGPAVALSVN
jgi:hypothetical protein